MRVIPVDENNLWKVIVERIEAGEYVFFDMVLLYRLKRRRVQFFPFDAADWARDLKPWLVPLRSAWAWMRAAALPVI
jgi:hypothetical protein